MPFNSIFEHPSNEVTGTETVETMQQKQAEAKETQENMSYEDIGQARLERITERTSQFKQGLTSSIGGFWGKLKGFGKKASVAGRKLGRLALATPEIISDAGSEIGEFAKNDYEATVEDFAKGMEKLTAIPERATEMWTKNVERARTKFQEFSAGFKERYAKYAQKQAELAEARRELLATPIW